MQITFETTSLLLFKTELQDLPDEILLRIFKYVVEEPSLSSCGHFAKLSLTCRKFHNITSDRHFLHPITKIAIWARPFVTKPPSGQFSIELLLGKETLTFESAVVAKKVPESTLKTFDCKNQQAIVTVSLHIWDVVGHHCYKKLPSPLISVASDAFSSHVICGIKAIFAKIIDAPQSILEVK